RGPDLVELVGEGEVGALDVDALAAVAALLARGVVLVLLRAHVGVDADAELVGREIRGLGRFRGRPVVGGQVVLEQIEVHGGLVFGDERLAAGAAADQGDGGTDVAGRLPRLVALRGVENVYAAVLLNLLVIQTRHLRHGDGGDR